MNNPQWLIIHHEAPPVVTNKPRFNIVNEYHKERFNMLSELGWYTGYHIFIEKDGTVIGARKDSEEGAHTIGKNSSSIGICLAGNFSVEMPTEAQKIELKKIIQDKMLMYNIPLANVVPHRKFANKDCYGIKLSDTWAQDVVTYNSMSVVDIQYQINNLLKLIAQLQEQIKKFLNKG